MSAVAEAESDLPAPRAPRPVTPVRLVLFALAVTGSAVVLAVGFPRGAPDRLPILLIALALALDAVVRPTAAIRAAALRLQIPCLTTLSAAAAAVEGIRAWREEATGVAALQEYHRT